MPSSDRGVAVPRLAQSRHRCSVGRPGASLACATHVDANWGRRLLATIL